jgi:penicillin-binding protein 1A
LSTKATRKKPARKRTARKKPIGANPIIIFLLLIAGLVTVAIGTGLAWFLSLDLPDIRSMDDNRPLVATRVVDRHGRPIDAIYKQYRIVITQHEMTPLLRKAFVAAEDSRYFSHPGIDLWSILRAAINNLRSGHRGQGGSTITQQVTRALMLDRKKTYQRKLTEAILAYRLDHILSKQDVLTIYLNEIYLGEGAYGVEAAARTYFSKSARELNLAEAALLAGLPQSPSRYSPIHHWQAAKARQRYVLNRMAEDGIITPAHARSAYNRPIRLNPSGAMKQAAGYFTDYVRSLLAREYGEKALYREGLTVWTTLDSRLQQAAVTTLAQGLKRARANLSGRAGLQGALVAIDSATGAIRALVGGASYTKSPFNRAVAARRQPGSVFKPIIYAAAFEQGISPELRLDDAPLLIRNPDGTTWKPRNYSHTYRGPTSLREALIHSNNIVTIKLLQKIHPGPAIALARKMGIHSELKPELPLALGAFPVTVLEMTGAYTVFADGGLYHVPRAITRVRDRKGRVRPWPAPPVRQPVSAATARTMTDILGQVISRGTGSQARGIPGAAGKTGTSDDNRDAWFIGYTDTLTTGVWVGYDRGRTLGRGGTGGRIAAPIWKEFMLQSRGSRN